MIVRHSTSKLPHLPIKAFVAFLFLLNAATWLPVAQAELERHLRVSEMAPVGHQIGYVTDKLPEMLDRSNFFIVFPEAESMAEKILAVNEKTGEVLLQTEADYEKETTLMFLAVPTDGTITIKVTVEILDENDNAPEFPVKDINLEISEYARIDTELVLPSAVDPDSERYAIKKYFIAGGNVNNVFRLATSKLNNAMYVDLVVNGQLDREYRDRYDLVVEAIDGGEPAKRGRLNVHVIILDANDNAPEFLHSRYSAQLTTNATIGSKVITVKARDTDAGENARITYRLAENQFNSHGVLPFKINSESGDITVDSSPPPPGTTYELIVIAADHGVPQPLESTVFVTVNVESTAAGTSKYDLNIVWLTEDGSARISEGLTLGYILARIAVRDYGIESLRLRGVDSLCLKQTDIPSVYLVLVCGPIDREITPELHVQFSLSNSKEDVILDHPIIVEILDVNDNPPKWNNTEFSIIFNRQNEKQPENVYRFIAEDSDSGENARIQYSLDSNDFFDIESETGILFAKEEIDCTIGNEISFNVIATDNGNPSLNSSAKVVVNVIDSDSKPPAFEKSLYEITIKEDSEISTCLLQVVAHDNSCGSHSSLNNSNNNKNKVHYSFKESSDNEIFKLDSLTGKICLQKLLDYENVSRYQLTIFATNSAERSSSTLVNVLIEDVNDNSPIFEPETYNITVYEDLPIGTALLSVQAFDEDQGKYGEVHYHIDSDNAFFHIDSHNGKLYSDKPLFSFAGQTINIKVIAKDSGGLTSQIPANIEVQILPAEVDCPYFARGLYEFTISEDILPGIVIGTVEAISSRALSYRIISGNNGKFQLDSKSGKLIVSKEQDADKNDMVLLNIEARASDNCASFSQIKIKIHDTNDNAPEFDMPEVETNVAENFVIHEPFFAVQAVDKDKHENGKVTYELIKSEPACPIIVRPLTGQLLLAAPLDFEKTKRYKITIRAQDQGIPPKASMAVVNLNVLDVNDNAPEFENQLYDFEVPEDASLMTSVGFLKAVDKDSDDNAEIIYKIVDERISDFGINSKTGELFVRQTLDRELRQDYSFVVLAEDKGSPPLSSNSSIHIRILDINDNTPNCTKISKLRVSEYLNPKEVIGQIEAFDSDAGLNGTVVYRLQQSNEFFEIKRTGEVILLKRLRQGVFKSPFQLSVIAEDQGPRPRPAVCTIIIELDETKSDVEILEPVDRTLKISTADEPGAKLVEIRASNAHQWSIEKSGISDYFSINNGTLTLKEHVDEQKFEKPQPLSVAISDSKGRKRYLSFIVRLHHISTPDNETIVTKVKETTAIGTKLLTLSQPQRALSDSYYSLVKNNPSFEIDEKTGSVYLARRLDYNNASVVQMKIQRENINAAHKKEMTLIFELDDINNHSPKFLTNNYTFNVLESTHIGSIVGRIEAFDDDDGINGIVKYRILGESREFSIDIKTGEIFLQKTLHFHVKPSYFFVAEAEDSATQSSDRRRSQSAIFINVIDTNDNSPVFKSPENITIRWASVFNYSRPIHYFVATDVDSGEYASLTYKIKSSNGNAFFLNQTTGALHLRQNIQDTAKLTIRTTDKSSTPRFSDQQFTIFIEHNSVEWSFFEKPAFTIKLNSAPIPGTIVKNFNRNDDRGIIKFGLFAPQKPTYFEIGESDGILRTSGTIKNGIHRLIAFATSITANATDYASVVVNIGDSIYEGPQINQNSCGNITIRENMAIPNMMQIFAYHEVNETDNPFFYHIEGGADGLFAINETNGMISCKTLDREKKAEHFLIISVSDNNMPKRADVCTVRVTVADENDNAPVFSSTSLQVIEISDLIQVPSLLLKFSATDADEGDNSIVKYFIKDDPSGSLDIDPDNGDLIFARDYSFPKSEFILIVAAEDYGNKVVKSSEQKLRVLWKRSTKGFLRGEPKFLQQKYITYVAEGLPKNTKVMKIETSNKIFADVPLTLSIVEGNYDSAFTIDADHNLRTAEELDAEIQTIYTLKVMATGKFVKSAETIIEIRVLDVNDNAPSVPPIKDIQLPENLPIGSYITTVMANDVDADVDLEFMITPPNEYFEIGRFTGAIFLRQPLDYEIEKAIVVGVQVFDGFHFVKTNFTINVQDINDNPPKFSSDLYKFKVSTNSAKNDIIDKVAAVDPDEGANGDFRFELLNDSDNLRLDSKTGELRLKTPLKEGMVYFAPIKAVDRGNPKLSSFATIQLQFVHNITHEIAEFKKESYSFLVAENYPLHLSFGQIDLKNQTLADYEGVSLQILDKAYLDIFHIHTDGHLLLLQNVDHEAVKEFRFRIGLIKNENGAISTPKSTANVIVKISDINDNAPTFTSDSTKVIKIDEQMKKGAILGRLTATDLDAADNGRIHYAILDGNQRGIIRVDSVSGAIIYDHWDDEELYENPGVNSFNLTFIATDNGSPPLWNVASAQLNFNIDTWSGSAPMFAIPVYHKFISENTATGSVVLKAQAHNKWDFVGNNWRYSISDNDEIFTIESHTGEIFLKGQLDYEKRNNYEFMVTVKDARHRSAVVPVEITVIGVDEFAPVFSKSSYTFEISMDAEVGQRIGNVFATDDDFGPDGKVYYSIPDDQYVSFIGIDPDNGVLVLREPFPINKTIEHITVIASSGLTQHSRATVYLEVESLNSIKSTNIFGWSALNNYIIIFGIVFVILFTLLCCIVFCIYFRSKNRKKKPQKQIYSVAKGNIAVMADINRMSPSYGKLAPSYSYDRTKTFSLISSNSSDRNSNMMIKSTHTDGFGIRSQPDSGIDPDVLSISSSVTDYLLQIGVTPTKLDPNQLQQLSHLSKPFSASDRLDPELSELIYAKVDDILAPGSRINANSSYDFPLLSASSLIPYTVDQMEGSRRAPTFQPLTEVFSQLSRMKSEQQQHESQS